MLTLLVGIDCLQYEKKNDDIQNHSSLCLESYLTFNPGISSLFLNGVPSNKACFCTVDEDLNSLRCDSADGANLTIMRALDRFYLITDTNNLSELNVSRDLTLDMTVVFYLEFYLQFSHLRNCGRLPCVRSIENGN